MRSFSDIPERLLGPLAGQDDTVWHGGPPGAWSPGEIVSHVATAIANSAEGFSSRTDKPAMRRRWSGPAVAVARLVVLTTGWIPSGRKSPATALPQVKPVRAATEAQLRAGVAALERLAAALLPARRHDLFVKHPVLGDLTIEEWMRFHVVHTEHHRKQLLRRRRGER